MAALGAQSIASSYEQLLHVDRDGGGNTTTHVSIKDGDNGTTFGFTIASDALMMSSTNRLEFGDTGTYIHQSADGVLDLVSDTEIEINATTIDLNGAVAMDGAITGGTNITISGELDAATLDISGNADIEGTTNLDAVDIDGAVQIDAAVTVGVDDQGYDFKFFGDTASAYMMWDTSADDLVFAGAAGIDLEGDIDVNGTANLDNTDIDGTLAVDGATISLDATTSLNIDNTNTSNGVTINTATSGGPISIGHTTSETTVNDNLVVTGDITSAGTVGIGVTPQAWDTTREVLQIGDAGFLASRNNANVTFLGNNWYRDASTTADTYINAQGENDEAIALELHNSGNFYLKTAPSGTGGISWTTPLTVANTGDVTIGTGDIVFATAGKGICLGVTSNTDSNTLDDYEEGTFTVTFAPQGGGSITVGGNNTMTYTKIGNICHVSGHIDVGSVGSPVGTYVGIGSLPFTTADTADSSGSSSGSVYVVGLGAAAATALYMSVSEGSTTMLIYESDGQAADGGFAAHWSASTTINLQLTYRTA